MFSSKGFFFTSLISRQFGTMKQTSSQVLSGTWSSEYIEHVVLRETVKLLNLRCLDLGYIPYNQASTGKVRLWGPPKFLRPFTGGQSGLTSSSGHGNSVQYQIKHISLESSLEELKLTPLSELLLKNCLLKLTTDD